MNNVDTARRYFQGFAENDHAAILELLVDDVEWHIHGHRHLRGKADFDSEIENEHFSGPPDLTIDHMIDAGDSVVVPHHGVVTRAAGGTFRFAACDLLVFEGGKIARVESWVVPLDGDVDTGSSPSPSA